MHVRNAEDLIEQLFWAEIKRKVSRKRPQAVHAAGAALGFDDESDALVTVRVFFFLDSC